MDRLIDLTARRTARQIGAYWDVVNRGTPGIQPPDSAEGAELATLIRSLQAAGDANVAPASWMPEPLADDELPPALLRRHQQLRSQYMKGDPMLMQTPAIALPRPRGELPTGRGAWERRSKTRLGYVAAIAAAMVVFLVIGLGRGPLGPGRHSGAPPRQIPARSVAIATPEPAADRTLVTFPLPADIFPDGGFVSTNLQLLSMPANSMASWQGASGGPIPGLQVDFVVAGELHVVADAEVEVIRGGTGKTETVGSGSETVLQPGDTYIHRVQQSKTWSSGAQEVTIASFTMLDDVTVPAAVGVGWTEVSYGPGNTELAIDGHIGLIPAGAKLVSLRQSELRPDESIPPPPDGSFQYAVMLPAGETYLIKRTDGSIRLGAADGPITVYVLTISLETVAASPEATP